MTPETVAEMIPALMDLPEEDRRSIRGLLLSVPDVSAGVVLEALKVERDLDRRREIISLLSNLGKAAVPAVLRRIEAAPPEDEARVLATFLGEIKESSAVPFLVSALRSTHARLRRDALRALIAIDTMEARRTLPALLADRDDEIVQIAAAHLGTIGDADTARDLLRFLDTGILTGMRAGKIKRAILALGRMRYPEAVGPLAGLLRRRIWISRRVRDDLGEAAAHALERIGGTAARLALEQAAGAASPAVAAVCKRLLSRWSAS